ncbi:3202_t:CDS:2 [Cetraspora pellucida]|uniref:3202_t:CDS:1 n=1 Tax=Cetraspora pellucida TaxID=1433469 RepID=A0ACA9K2V9_9GLOM|nr:3202_t:CDS:2 [Cetraspora pellucida]
MYKFNTIKKKEHSVLRKTKLEDQNIDVADEASDSSAKRVITKDLLCDCIRRKALE